MSDVPLMNNYVFHRYITMKGIRYHLKATGCIWTDDERCGGRPCLRGHRYTLHQLFEELAEVHNEGLKAIADNYQVDFDLIKGALVEVAQLFDRLPETKGDRV